MDFTLESCRAKRSSEGNVNTSISSVVSKTWSDKYGRIDLMSSGDLLGILSDSFGDDSTTFLENWKLDCTAAPASAHPATPNAGMAYLRREINVFDTNASDLRNLGNISRKLKHAQKKKNLH
jgi:hypothetical protein